MEDRLAEGTVCVSKFSENLSPHTRSSHYFGEAPKLPPHFHKNALTITDVLLLIFTK